MKGTYRVEVMSFGRRLIREACSFLRLAVGFALTLQGTQYLVYTIAIEELLLNAVALEFVMKLDELIFESLAPTHVRRIVQRTVGFTLPTNHVSGIDRRTVLSCLVVIAQMSWGVATYMVPQLIILESVKGAICGGDRDFVYAIDGMGVVVWGYPPSIASSLATLQDSGYSPWPEYRGENGSQEDIDLNEQTVNSILEGWARTECPSSSCYYSGEAAQGAPAPVPLPASVRAACCLPTQTRAPSIEYGKFSVLSKASARLPETADMCAHAQPNAKRSIYSKLETHRQPSRVRPAPLCVQI